MSFFTEYRNQHSYRKYPFSDDCSLMSEGGMQLANNVILDVFIYSYSISGGVYMSKLDVGNMKIYFSDSSTDVVLGYAVVDRTNKEDDSTWGHDLDPDAVQAVNRRALIYDDYGREIGAVVYGDGIDDVLDTASALATATEHLFTANTAELCPTCILRLNQPGVQGFLLPDGTVVYGSVSLKGQDGVIISTHDDTIITIDFIGSVAAEQGADCGDCPLIKTICFERMPGSSFMISKIDDSTIALTSYGFDQDDICVQQKIRELPDTAGNLPLGIKSCDDPCGTTPVPPGPPIPGNYYLYCLDVASANGLIAITTPSTIGYINPIIVDEIDSTGREETPRLNANPAGAFNTESVLKPENFRNQSDLSEGLAIAIKGIPQFKRATQ